MFAPTASPGGLQDVQVVVLEMAGGPVVTVEVSVNACYGYVASVIAFAAVESLHTGARVAVPKEAPPALYA